MKGSLAGSDIISISDFSNSEIEHVFEVADSMSKNMRGNADLLKGKLMAAMFFEPSTRTRFSFEASMHRLGGAAMDFANTEGTSVAKGENLADTIRVIDTYADVIVIRHKYEGAARLAAKFASHPVINAGDGSGQHPTQTLLDLYTMKKSKGTIKGLKVGLVGDLKYGRTVHSLAYALSKLGAKIYLISPDMLQMPSYILSDISKSAIAAKTDKLEDVIGDLDVIYMTRVQKERFGDLNEYAKVSRAYTITTTTMSKAKKDAILMHPLPRISEISKDVDNLKAAKYFEQASNGIPIRMALLSMVLGAKR
ncbi:aspartate carbamoyltransferase catalytic subunit [mine drainage metagenome]|uniref:aspartate carbamoyltransferase n=1 Tax=mine drainage metagenome TaxID=410659 RepID=T0Z2Y3_9ZZZZ